MKLLKRNLTEFEYLPFTGEETDLNDDGEHTGEFRPEYGEPVLYKGNISAPSGHTVQQFYGEDIRYTHTLVMDKPDVAIDEHGMIRWKGDLYEITAIRPSLNVMSIALKRITGTVEEEFPDDDTDDDTDDGGGDGE